VLLEIYVRVNIPVRNVKKSSPVDKMRAECLNGLKEQEGKEKYKEEK
jgi:hypothetical protein